MSESLYVVGGTVLTMNAAMDILENGVVEVRDGKIKQVGSADSIAVPAGARTVDARHCLVLPGFINGHTHTGMGLIRGIAEDLPFDQWLNDVILPTEKRWGSPEFVYIGTMLSCAEMIKAGTTTFNDMYHFEEASARAAHAIGMRAICAQDLSSITWEGEKGGSVAERMDEFRSALSGFERITPALGPHAIYTVDRLMFEELISYAADNNLLVHMHLSETKEEVRRCLRENNQTPPEYCNALGLFNVKTVCAHGTCLSPSDIALLASRQVGIVHNPESNLKLETKICPVPELRHAGVAVGLGTDSVASNNDLDLLQEADTAAKLQTYRKGIGTLTAQDTVRMMTIDGARALHMDSVVGSLEVGKRADIVCIDTNKPNAVPLYNPYAQLVYSSTGADARHTMVEGELLMEDYRLTRIDEQALLDEARAWGKRIYADYHKPSAGGAGSRGPQDSALH
ncbi:MAG: amidohydrolase [Bdellovibrionales bacterium]|nr:amidohydrolase [Bdellovibrionales bacterium]